MSKNDYTVEEEINYEEEDMIAEYHIKNGMAENMNFAKNLNRQDFEQWISIGCKKRKKPFKIRFSEFIHKILNTI